MVEQAGGFMMKVYIGNDKHHDETSSDGARFSLEELYDLHLFFYELWRMRGQVMYCSTLQDDPHDAFYPSNFDWSVEP